MKCQFVIFLLSFFLLSCSEDTIELIPYKSGDQWGYISNNGNIVINPQFKEAYIFNEGYALVMTNVNTYGFISKDGKFKINATFKNASFFSEGLACVVNENGKPMYIDVGGNIKFEVSNGDECGLFKEQLATIKVGDKWGYIDDTGMININPQFDVAYPFSEGLAVVGQKNNKNEVSWGFINKAGEVVINYQFRWAGKFTNGISVVYDGKNYGFIDKNGKFVINPQYSYAEEFVAEKALISQGSMYGYIDKGGNFLINPQFKKASSFSSVGLASVSNADGKYGYIDSDGKYLINPQFEYASDFFGKIAFVKSVNKYGIIDSKGKYIANPQFDEINVENKSFIYKTIQNDFFDVNNIISKFIAGTDVNNFYGLNSNTTFADLNNIHDGLILDNNTWSATIHEEIKLNESISIAGILYNFRDNPILETKPVYKNEQKYDATKGGYYDAQIIDHYEEIANENAKLKSVVFFIQLYGEKALEKSDLIFKGIISEISSKASLSSSSTQASNNINMLENKNYSLRVDATVMSKGSYAKYELSFKNI